MASRRTGHFTRNGERGNWGANLSRALWYTSQGSGGTAKEGRLTVSEFLQLLHHQVPGGLREPSRWSDLAWEVKLPNGTLLGFQPDPPSPPGNF